jgi:hypothetical protein
VAGLFYHYPNQMKAALQIGTAYKGLEKKTMNTPGKNQLTLRPASYNMWVGVLWCFY